MQFRNKFDCNDGWLQPGPFIITSQGSQLHGLPEVHKLSWNVANYYNFTNQLCECNDMYFQQTAEPPWPTTLAASVPNGGYANITAPNIATTQGRVMVKAVGNVFWMSTMPILQSMLFPLVYYFCYTK